MDEQDKLNYYRQALVEIAKCEGAFNMDNAIFAANVIENMKRIADETLAEVWVPPVD